MKHEIEAVKQFDSRISNTEQELLTLKHTVQSETTELKENHNILHNLQKNISDAVDISYTAYIKYRKSECIRRRNILKCQKLRRRRQQRRRTHLVMTKLKTQNQETRTHNVKHGNL
jgi:hypothetical protein